MDPKTKKPQHPQPLKLAGLKPLNPRILPCTAPWHRRRQRSSHSDSAGPCPRPCALGSFGLVAEELGLLAWALHVSRFLGFSFHGLYRVTKNSARLGSGGFNDTTIYSLCRPQTAAHREALRVRGFGLRHSLLRAEAPSAPPFMAFLFIPRLAALLALLGILSLPM